MMKKQLNLNSKWLPFVVIFIGTLVFFIYDPPHSICSTQLDSYRKSLRGAVYGYLDSQKNVIPAKIKKSVEDCRIGKSSGSCIDYFEIINKMMLNLNQVEESCMAEVINQKDISEILKKFFVIVTVLAWGDELPKENKTNWLSDSNILVYCKVKKNLMNYFDKDDFNKLINFTLNSLPYERLSFDYSEDSEEFKKNRAILKIDRSEVINKSMLSLRCERFL